MKANCEECGNPIEAEFSLCEKCEVKLYGTISGEPINDPHDDSVKCCPDCERPNQFGELCAGCQRERDAEACS